MVYFCKVTRSERVASVDDTFISASVGEASTVGAAARHWMDGREVILSIFFLGGEKRLRHTASLCSLIPKVDAHAGMMYILSSPVGTSPNVFSCVRSGPVWDAYSDSASSRRGCGRIVTALAWSRRIVQRGMWQKCGRRMK